MADDDKKGAFSWDEEDQKKPVAAAGGGFTWDSEPQPNTPPKPKPDVVDLPGATPRLIQSVKSGQTTADFAKPKGFESQHRLDPFNRQANEFLLGAASGASGLPETLTPIKSAVTGEGAAPPPHDLKGIGEDIAEKSIPGAGLVRMGFGLGKELLSGQQPGESEEDASARRAHAVGTGVGLGVGAMSGETGEALTPIREAAAQKLVAPLARKPPVATMKDLKYGQNAGRAISKEGLVAGSKEGLIQGINERVGHLSDVLDNTLKTAPGANEVINAEPIIDKAIDSAVKQARKAGSAATETRLEALRTALKTEHGPINGTPLEINNLKRSVGDVGSDMGAFKATDPVEASAASAMEDVYHDLKDAVNEKVPEGEKLNGRIADLISARTGVNRNIALNINKSPFSALHPIHAGMKALEATAGSTPIRTGIARGLNVGNTLDIPGLSAIPGSTGVAPPPQPPQQLQRIGGPQMTLGLPPQNAPLFNINVPGGPNSAPVTPPPPIERIAGPQESMPFHDSPLFNIQHPSGPSSPVEAATTPGKLEAIQPNGPTPAAGGQGGIRERALESLKNSLETIEPPKGGAPQKVKDGIKNTGFEFVGHKADAEFPGLGMTELRGPGNISVTILDKELENLTAAQIRGKIEAKLKDFGRTLPKPGGRSSP